MNPVSQHLPAKWVSTTIGEVAQVNPPGVTTLDDDDLVSFIPMASVEPLSGTVDLSQRRPFREVKKGFTRFQDDDLLFAKITPCMENGKIAVVRGLQGGIGCGSTEFHVIRPRGGVNVDYLRYFTVRSAFRKEARKQMQGAVGQQRVPPEVIRLAPIPLPPTKEQNRIVAKIDELFSDIEDGERALSKVLKLVERYRQSVLKAAVTGELTREWREKHKDELESRECLLRRIRRGRREAWERRELAKMKAKGQKPRDDGWKKKYEEPDTPDSSELPDLPRGWVWVTFEHIAECLDFARQPVSAAVRAKRPGAIPYYGANGQVGTIDTYLFDEPLVLVVEDETFTGRTKPFSYKIEGKSWVNNHAHVLRATSETDIDFLNLILMRYPFIPLTTGTTARRKLTQKSLMRAPVAVPGKSEQLEIVSAINERLSFADPIEKSGVESATLGKALKESILTSAFRGELVAQQPADECASALLERIAHGSQHSSRSAANIRNRLQKVTA